MADADNNDIEDDMDAPDPKKRGLGRGLGALFEDEEVLYASDDTDMKTADGGGQPQPGAPARRMAGVDQLEPGPFQPRQYIGHDALDELSESIKKHGIIQPIVVRAKDDDNERFQIIAGERRWRAAQKAQLHEVPIIVREMEDEQVLEVALIENLQREDLNVLEEAQGYQRLIDEFSHTQEKLAEAVGKSRSYVANIVRLLSLPQGVQVMIRQDKLSAGHARALITADNPEELARQIVENGYSVRDAENLVAESKGKKPKSKSKGSKAAPKDVNTIALENDITNLIGMKTEINANKDGSGKIAIHFKTLDQLDEILHRLQNPPS